MKKRAALLVALSLAVVTVLAGCGGKDSSKSADSKDSAATFEEKKEGATFTVGFDQDFPVSLFIYFPIVVISSPNHFVEIFASVPSAAISSSVF